MIGEIFFSIFGAALYDVAKGLRQQFGANWEQRFANAYNEAANATLDAASRRDIAGMLGPAPNGSSAYRQLSEFLLNSRPFGEAAVKAWVYGEPMHHEAMEAEYPAELRGVLPLIALANEFSDRLHIALVHEFGQGQTRLLSGVLFSQLREEVRREGERTREEVRGVEQRITEAFEARIQDLMSNIDTPRNEVRSEPSFTVASTASLLPSDEAYSVLRPEIDDLAHRLQIEHIVGVWGGAGVGKSVMALHYAHEHYPQRTLYVSMDSGVPTRTQMDDLGRALGLEFPAGLSNDAVSRPLKAGLSEFDGLLVLDNAYDPDETSLFLPNPGTQCKVIITSQDKSLLRRVATTGAEPIEMDVFTVDQAQECFRAHLDEEQCHREQGSISSLCKLLEYLPVAVDVAARTIRYDGNDVARWVDTFPDEQAQLEGLGGRSADEEGMSDDEVRRHRIVWAVLGLSLRGLPPSATQLLYALACFDASNGGPEVVAEAMVDAVEQGGIDVVQLTQVPADEPRPATRYELNRLHLRSILSAPTPGIVGGQRHRMHRLMQAVVRDRAKADGLLNDYYTAYFDVYSIYPIPLMQLATTVRVRALRQEEANLYRIAETMTGRTPFPTRDRVTQRIAFQQQRTMFAALLARNAGWLSWPPLFQRELFATALQDAETARLAAPDAYSWHAWQAYLLLGLGDLAFRENDFSAARSLYNQSYDKFSALAARQTLDPGRETAAIEGRATAQRALGDLALERDPDEARTHYREALDDYQHIGDEQGEGIAAASLAGLCTIKPHKPGTRRVDRIRLVGF